MLCQGRFVLKNNQRCRVFLLRQKITPKALFSFGALTVKKELKKCEKFAKSS
jgi:hypothetical protein